MAVEVTLHLPEHLVEHAKRFGEATQREHSPRPERMGVEAIPDMMFQTSHVQDHLGPDKIVVGRDLEVLFIALDQAKHALFAPTKSVSIPSDP